jgi:hypothetical protein
MFPGLLAMEGRRDFEIDLDVLGEDIEVDTLLLFAFDKLI